MIERLTATQFDRQAGNGRTEPGFIVAENEGGDEIELIAKISAKCDRAATSLAIELLCACLAGDIGLPVPQPYVVNLETDWIDSIADLAWANAARNSIPLAFGSRRAPAGFGQWIAGTSMVEPISSVAAGILLFDAVTDNPDRRSHNPNCLQRGQELRIIDHELCFGSLILGWKPPWQVGALHHLSTLGQHIFRDALRGREIDWGPIIAPWKLLSDDTISDYEHILPAEWAAALPAVQSAIAKIKNARDHIEECAIEVQRVPKC